MTKDNVHIYYLRDPQQKHLPVGCVAICENSDGTINRGVSLCSYRDNFSKRRARNLATARLSLACKGMDIRFGKYYGRKAICMPDCPFEHSSQCNVKPTEYEYRILHKPEHVKQ